jgi:hypothetical protein
MSALMNILKEKEFLQTKIQQLMCTRATPSQLRDTKLEMTQLGYRLENIQKKNDSLVAEISDAEIVFVKHILDQFDIEMDKMTAKRNLKARKDLGILGKWQFLKDWVDDRKEQNWVMKKLSESIDVKVTKSFYRPFNFFPYVYLSLQQRTFFRTLIPEEDELNIIDSDTAEVRKMKASK